MATVNHDQAHLLVLRTKHTRALQCGNLAPMHSVRCVHAKRSPPAPDQNACCTHAGKRYACLALGNLAVASANHEEILAAEGLESLSSALDCDDKETVFNACYALNKLAMNDANHEVGRAGQGRATVAAAWRGIGGEAACASV